VELASRSVVVTARNCHGIGGRRTVLSSILEAFLSCINGSGLLRAKTRHEAERRDKALCSAVVSLGKAVGPQGQWLLAPEINYGEQLQFYIINTVENA